VKLNVGRLDRLARAAAALGMLVCAMTAPVPLAVRIGLVAAGVYVTITVVAGRCVGYSLLGLSTCPLDRAPDDRRSR
jgi:hypothetical protein